MRLSKAISLEGGGRFAASEWGCARQLYGINVSLLTCSRSFRISLPQDFPVLVQRHAVVRLSQSEMPLKRFYHSAVYEAMGAKDVQSEQQLNVIRGQVRS